MSKRKKWHDLFEEASQDMESWRQHHKKATFSEIEDTVDSKLAILRAKMIEDLAMASEMADLRSMGREERPKCLRCGQPVLAKGRQKRELTTDHEQGIELKRREAYSRQCKLSFLPSG